MNLKVFNLAIKIYLLWLMLIILFYLAGNILFGGGNDLSFSDFANWDGRHFLEIAQKGYVDKVQYAFFPLYPLLINFSARFFNINFLYAGLFINLLFAFGSVYVFLSLLSKYSKNSIKAVIYFLIFPTSFYLITAYSESLFLFLSLLAFFFAEKRNFFYAAIFAALTSLTRITGIAVILSLAVYVFLSDASLKKKIAIPLISFTGIIFYCLYLFIQTGNPLYFFVSELSWGRMLFFPGINILDSVSYIAVLGIKPESFTIFSDLLFTMFGLGMGIRTIRFLKPPLAAYTIISLLIPLTTTLLLSFPRFILIIFPIFIVTSKVQNRIFNAGYVIISLALLFLYFNFFLRNIWVS